MSADSRAWNRFAIEIISDQFAGKVSRLSAPPLST